MTPHLHWHVIPRFADDAHFPSPVWAGAQRTADAATLASRAAQLDALRAALARQTAQ
jgi:diadenosine tetraphosphate (Ap4A) HIT family hydrolase